MNNRSYFAIFDYENQAYNIWFPDLEGCYTCADTLDEVPESAKEALELWLFGLEEDGHELPQASVLSELKIAAKQTPLLVTVNMSVVRDQMNNRAVKKTLSIPAWLNTRAEAAGINFSQTLQEALKDKLG